MGDESKRAVELWSALRRASQQVMDDFRAQGRELEPRAIVDRVTRLFADVGPSREALAALLVDLRSRLGRGKRGLR